MAKELFTELCYPTGGTEGFCALEQWQAFAYSDVDVVLGKRLSSSSSSFIKISPNELQRAYGIASGAVDITGPSRATEGLLANRPRGF